MSKRKENSTNSLNREDLIDFCGMNYALDLLSGRWKLTILYKLEKSNLRYNEIRQHVPKVTDRMLTLHLREMERDGLVTRTVYHEFPAKVEYKLTESARSLAPVWQALESWGIDHRKTQKNK